MNIIWPSSLIDDIARRKSVIFLGSGISRQSRNLKGETPKGWLGFLEAAIARLIYEKGTKVAIKKLLKAQDYLTACQLIKDHSDNAAFHQFLKDEFQIPAFQSAPIHETIANLDSRIFATPNFDKIFDTYINSVQHGSVTIKHYYDNDLAEVIRSTNPIIIKVHGTVDEPNKVIFTRTQYAQARNDYRNFYTILEALAITHTFLFLGCGLNDPDIRLLLEDYAFTHTFGKPHYFVIPKSDVAPQVIPSFERSMNIKILTYDSKNYHSLLQPAIQDLVDLVNVARIDFQLTGRW